MNLDELLGDNFGETDQSMRQQTMMENEDETGALNSKRPINND